MSEGSCGGWRRWTPFLGGLGYGALTALAFAPVGWWPLALVAVAPLVWAGRCGWSPGRFGGLRTAVMASAGTLPMWLFEQRWLVDVTVPGYPALAVYLSAYAGVFVWLMRVIGRAWPGVPVAASAAVVWTGLEMVRGEVVLTGYPWYLAGHPLIEGVWPAWPAALLGAYFVSALVAGVCGGLVEAGLSRNGAGRRRGLVSVGVVVLIWGAGTVAAWGVSDTQEGFEARVSVVQTNVPQSNKMEFRVADRLEWMRGLMRMTRAAAEAEPAAHLIVWPETMFPGGALNDDAVAVFRRARLAYRMGAHGQEEEIPYVVFADALKRLQEDLGIPMLVGAVAYEGLEIGKGEGDGVNIDYRARFNSAFVLVNGRVNEQRYDKMHLTPFGEVIPYLWRFPRVQDAVVWLGAVGMGFDLKRGSEPVVFSVGVRARILEEEAGGEVADGMTGGTRVGSRRGTIRFVTPICFEATMTRVCRGLVHPKAFGRPAASLIINMSNDGWFGAWDGGREQHLQAARWRCVELGVPMVRAVNTGISCVIDGSGRLLKSGVEGQSRLVDVEGVMNGRVRVSEMARGTVYGRIGNVFGWMMMVMTLVAGAVGYRRAVRGGENDEGARA